MPQSIATMGDDDDDDDDRVLMYDNKHNAHTATNGVVIATEKKLPSVLIDEAHVQKVELINPSTGMYVFV